MTPNAVLTSREGKKKHVIRADGSTKANARMVGKRVLWEMLNKAW